MREKDQEASDRRHDAGVEVAAECGDRSGVRRLFEVIRNAVRGFYVAFVAWMTRWLQDSWSG